MSTDHMAERAKELLMALEYTDPPSGKEIRAFRAVARALQETGRPITIAESDGEPEDLNAPTALWVVSEHKLMLGHTPVAEWTRCSRGNYSPQQPYCWECEEDTEGGDYLPEHVKLLLQELGMGDEIPDVPEPTAPEPCGEEDAGAAVWYSEWEHEEWRVISYYETLTEAQRAASISSNEFRAAYPTGTGHYWTAKRIGERPGEGD